MIDRMKRREQTRRHLLAHYERYPALTVADLFKYLHQSAFGCEHLVTSLADAVKSIARESLTLSGDDGALAEPLDGAYSRVSLSYLSLGLSAHTFGKLFFTSVRDEPNARRVLEDKLAVAEGLVREGRLPFGAEAFARERDAWRAAGYPALHHSDAFRERYRPAYRVIANRYIPLLPLFARLDALLARGDVLLAVDGGSASGKTTLGAMLGELYSATVLHMDDFFLRPEQRTEARYAEIGGNVDRERFLAEVLLPLAGREPFLYRRFDCGTMTLLPAERICPRGLTVIEGVYAMHPALSEYYDLSVFLSISPEEQGARIRRRNTKEMAERFFREWIPLEEAYFLHMRVAERCDLRISGSENCGEKE